eukprot:SAG31_NODE_1627_length_7705_cov_5.310939_4_plen_157_part_00
MGFASPTGMRLDKLSALWKRSMVNGYWWILSCNRRTHQHKLSRASCAMVSLHFSVETRVSAQAHFNNASPCTACERAIWCIWQAPICGFFANSAAAWTERGTDDSCRRLRVLSLRWKHNGIDQGCTSAAVPDVAVYLFNFRHGGFKCESRPLLSAQ